MNREGEPAAYAGGARRPVWNRSLARTERLQREAQETGHREERRDEEPTTEGKEGGARFTDLSFVGRTKSEACEGVRRGAHTLMGGPNLGWRLPSYCGDCAREVVTEGGKSVERWVCRVTVEIFK